MTQIILYTIAALNIYSYLILARVIVEMIRSFSPGWRPSGIIAIVFEVIFTVTDPPINALRKIIPPLPLGGITLDMSIIVLFLLLMVARMGLGALL